MDTLADSFLELINNACRFRCADASVEYHTAVLAAKSANIVSLETKLSAQVAAMDTSVDALRAEAQGNHVVLEAKLTCLAVWVPTDFLHLALHIL